MVAITSLLLVIAIGLLVTRIATVILVATGLSTESARFQARSAFTGTGFTTTESEHLLNHPVRRRVVMTLMLLGNAGIVAAAGSLIIGFRNGSLVHNWKSITELVAGLAALIVLSRSRRVSDRTTNLISRLLQRYTDLHERDLAGLLDLGRSYAVSELAVGDDDWVAHRRLDELDLRDEGIAVLGVTRRDGRFRGAPVGSTTVHPGDVLVVYGHGEALDELDRRRAGPVGDRAHQAAVEHQVAVVAAEEASDRGSAPEGSGRPATP